jgi:transcriptional regulator with PAS, ATPase and Fis domain
MESELFGYEGGAFTGAREKGKMGLFELANHGTILLDEIGDMSLALQAKLLRTIQESEILRVGGSRSVHLDVRILSATSRDIEAMMAEGRFLDALYYRLNVVELQIPPLRERREDILPLAEFYLQHFCEKYKLTRELSPGGPGVLHRL